MVLLELVCLANGHTWIEQLNLIDPTGNMVGEPGFSRGHIFRNDSAFNDAAAQHQITGPTVSPNSPMCRDSQQQQQQQPNAGPVLQAPPRAAIALRYLENGHVTQKDIRPRKPANGGTVYVYGTSQPQPNDLLLDIHRVWNADGTGGDGRGKLLSTQNFDDGQCYQVNPASQVYNERVAQFPQDPVGENWCQQDIALPDEATSGLYTLYWVWDWPDMPDSSNGVNQELYTSCMDVQIADESDGIVSTFTNAGQFVAPQAWNNQAVSSEMANITNPTAVDDSKFTVAFSTTASDSSATPATTDSASSTTAFESVPAALSTAATSTSDSGSAPDTSTILPIPGSTSSADSSPATSTAFQSSSTPAFSTSLGSQPTGTTDFGSGESPTTTDAPVTPQFTPDGQTTTVTDFDSVVETIMKTVTAGTTLEKRLRRSESSSIPQSTQTQPPATRTAPQPTSKRPCTHRVPRHNHIGLRPRGRKSLFILSTPPQVGDEC